MDSLSHCHAGESNQRCNARKYRLTPSDKSFVENTLRAQMKL